MSEPARVLSRAPADDHDNIVVLEGATWADYQRILAIRGEKGNPRITYLDGWLQIMATSRTHERIKSVVGCLIETWCLERGVEFSPYGNWTLQNRRKKGGLE